MTIIPDVKLVLGEPIAKQDAWRRAFEGSLTTRVKELGADGFSSADERAEWTAKMEILSGGKNSIKWVDDGDATPKYFPTIVVKFPALRICDLLENSTNQNLHPAFIVNGTVYPEIYVGKYQAYQITSNSKNIGVSLYSADPKVYTNFDTSFSLCGNGGAGHHLVTNAEWAMIALLAKNINAYQPKGNNNYGKDYADPATLEYYGVPSYMYDDKIGRVGTGTGPVSWAHDGSPWGCYDMNGNVWEWVSGLRQAAGEIQVIENNNAADSSIDVSRDSALWKALDVAGAIATPEVTFASDGDKDGADTEAGATLHWNPSGGIKIDTTTAHTTGSGSTYLSYDGIEADGVNVASLPETCSLLGVAPEIAGGNAHGGDRFYLRCPDVGVSNSYVETLARRGGNWGDSSSAGVFSLALSVYRSYSSHSIGSRPAFANL